ncbi:hypothetical protein REH65_31240 [Saccharopolyspora sp. ID03-671]|uniref:hypothetical protein n=1 Tax=Saccharopolyspora sp. ID03-671 TaxID=3073066 RepID=UPI003252F1AB
MNSYNSEPPPSTPALWINPDTPEGAVILALFRRLKGVEKSDGSWPGSDVADELTDWLARIGLHPDDDPDQAVRHLRTRPRTWTVFGLRDNDADGETLIAAVVAGEITCRDTAPGEEGGYQRVALSVVATGPDEAERRAFQLFEVVRPD